MASHGSGSDSSTTASSGHTARSGSHGSAAGSIPEAAATASVTSRCGEGNTTLAQTPSARPVRAPSTADIRWVSQRSMPRVGTATTSGANGSCRALRQERGERVGEGVGAGGTVDVEHGSRRVSTGPAGPHEVTIRTEVQILCVNCLHSATP